MGTHRVWNQIYFPNFFAQSSLGLHLLDKYFPLHWEQIEFPNPQKRIPVSTSSKKTVLRTWVLKTRQFEIKEQKIPFSPIFKKLQDNSKRPFFSLFLMRKPLSIGSNAMLMFSFNCVMIHCLVAYLQYYCRGVVKPKNCINVSTFWLIEFQTVPSQPKTMMIFIKLGIQSRWWPMSTIWRNSQN